jgi:TolB-like protein/regulator of sirC expression with transglutaminase-like and TPR domain
VSIRQAVELVAKVARTVHYAHEHGILHRDIKPGNILLDENREPHLTDFGLARLVESESTVTATLDVLGTPSYMAPEQAAGNNTNLTKATDVYGCGAVFYQLLTGHPPFAGGTTYETIKLLLETEPKQPRQLNPKIDRDLSTICLKCLEKDPQRRYSSALALAEDFEHWLKHEPIQARRTGILTRGTKWVRRNPTSTLLAVSLLALAAIVGWITWKSEFVRPPLTSGVAVLPFENLSGNPDNVYFADGIQEEILTRLASIAALKVISRTSTQHYQGKSRNLREIARELGVVNIVEGSVQKAADQVRVNVQLINAETDSHLWADSYDRKLTDILGVESEIAKRIAESLQAKLTGREKQALAVKPTNNPEAYEAYLRGLALEERNYFSSYSIELEEKAAGFYERAVQLDQNFAVAWARLSRADGTIRNATGTRGDATKRALERAQKLAPDSPETLLALVYYQYMTLNDPGAANSTLARVSQMVPNSGEVPWILGLLARNEGHWDQSVAYSEQALALDPRNVQYLTNAALTYVCLRQFPAALKLYDRVLDITPNDSDVVAAKAGIYQAQGNLPEAAKLLSGINEQTPDGATFESKIDQLRLERNYNEGIRLLKARLAQFHYASEQVKLGNQMNLSLLLDLAGNTAGIKVLAEQARNTIEQSYRKALEQPYTEERKNYHLGLLSLRLAYVYTLMGEKDSALKLAERAIILNSRAGIEFVSGAPGYEESLAWIQAMFGENSRAISALTHLLQTPYIGKFYEPSPVTRAVLRLDPMWDRLRADPAFQKLCEEKQ